MFHVVQCALGKDLMPRLWRFSRTQLLSEYLSLPQPASPSVHLYKPPRGKQGHLMLFQNIWKIVIGVGRAGKAPCAQAPGISGKPRCDTYQMILKHPWVGKYPNCPLSAFTSNNWGLARTLSSDLCDCSHASFKSLFWHF